MYLISGKLFFIASFFIFISNYVISNIYYEEINGFISFFAVISLLMGAIFYYVHYSKNNQNK